MIVQEARFQGRPGTGDQIEAALREVTPLVLAGEPGCPLYLASRAQDDPDLFLIYEHYVNEAALAAHRETPHFQRIVQGAIHPLLAERQVRLFTLLEDGA